MSYSSEDIGFSAFFGLFYVLIWLYCWVSVLRWSQCLRRREVTDSCGFNVILGLCALVRTLELTLSLVDSSRFEDEVRRGGERRGEGALAQSGGVNRARRALACACSPHAGWQPMHDLM